MMRIVSQIYFFKKEKQKKIKEKRWRKLYFRLMKRKDKIRQLFTLFVFFFIEIVKNKKTKNKKKESRISKESLLSQHFRCNNIYVFSFATDIVFCRWSKIGVNLQINKTNITPDDYLEEKKLIRKKSERGKE